MAFDASFFQNLPVGAMRAALDGTILEVNDHACAIVGRDTSELVGKAVSDLYWDPSEREGLLARIRAGAHVISPWEVCLRHRSGEPVWVWATLRVVRDEAGRPVEIHGVFGESERIPKTVGHLEAALERQQVLTEIAYHAMRAKDSRALLELVGEGVRRGLKAPFASVAASSGDEAVCRVMVGRPEVGPFEVALDLTDGAVSVSDCRALADEKHPLGKLCRRMASFGVMSFLAVKAESLRLEGPGLVVLAGGAEPRTWQDEDVGFVQAVALEAATGLDKFLLLERQKHQAEFLGRLLEMAPVGILFFGAGFEILRINEQAEKLLQVLGEDGRQGARLSDALGRRFARIGAAGDQSGLGRLTLRGRVLDVSVRMLEEGAGLGGMLVVLQDVTESERIRRLAESQERLAAVGQLAAGIAHDFNNLLTGIIGYSQLALETEDLTESLRESLTLIAGQGRRAAKLVRQLTDYSRKSILVRRMVDLVPVARSVLELLIRTLPESVVVETEAGCQACMVHADRVRMEQVLTNLILNAVDAIEGTGRVRVKLDVVEMGQQKPFPDMKPGPWGLIVVEDNGPGIPEELRHKIFEPFFTTKPTGEGTGLGLSQVYGIVKQHDGFVEVTDSELGGAAFRVYLPALRRDGVPTETERGSSDRILSVPKGQGQRVLVVEDDEQVRRAIVRMVRSLGYEVEDVGGKQEALDLLVSKGFSFDVVLSDVVMPGGGGLELAAESARLAPDLPFVMVSGYPMGQDGDGSPPANIVGWLSKPLDVAAIGIQLAEAVSGRDEAGE